MRGEKFFDFYVPQLANRITPACAGKRFASVERQLADWDHPRVRGEKPQLADVGRPGIGITPACAGKSIGFTHQVFGRWDHPRVRGEKRVSCTARVRFMGSPPRARGKGD